MFVEANGTIYVGAVSMPLDVFCELEPEYAAVGNREYDGARHVVRQHGKQYGGEVPWAEGDVYLSSEEAYSAEMEQRAQAAAAAREAALTYADRRRAEYPPIGDQLDALWKQLAADQAAGKQLEPDANALLAQVVAVKSAYPKGG